MHGSTSAEASGRVGHLVDRHPTVSPQRLIAQLRPPPTFAEVSFATYRPDPVELLPGVGLYLDGGFGVGETHPLASAYYRLPGPGPDGAADAPSRPTALRHLAS